jgi:thiol-disulfide isomerase/thioredoxin
VPVRRLIVGATLLAMTPLVASCGPSGAGATEPPRRATEAGAPAAIVLDQQKPKRARLLWLDGRPAQQVGDASVVPDGQGGWLAFDERLRVTSAPDDLQARPLAAVAGDREGNIWGIDGQGEMVAVGGGIAARPAIPFGVVAVDPVSDAIWLVRASDRVSYRMPGDVLPLFERFYPATGEWSGVGEAWLPDYAMLQDLANAGHLVAHGDTLYYAPFIRDELLALTTTGDTIWRATRGFVNTTTQPSFGVVDGRPVVDYQPVNFGLAWTPIGTLLLLSVDDGSPVLGRLDEFDPATGALLATTQLPNTAPTLAVAEDGRVHLLTTAALLGNLPPRRLVLADTTLPMLDGSSTRSLADYAGQPLILNFWASWCAPCRKELPALDSLRRVLETEGIAVVGMNDDRDADAARRFLALVAPDFPSFEGGGGMQERFGYLGLPWTLLLDARGEVVGQWIGELNDASLQQLATAARAELQPGAASGEGINP